MTLSLFIYDVDIIHSLNVFAFTFEPVFYNIKALFWESNKVVNITATKNTFIMHTQYIHQCNINYN